MFDKKYERILVEMSPMPVIEGYFNCVINKIKEMGIRIEFNREMKHWN